MGPRFWLGALRASVEQIIIDQSLQCVTVFRWLFALCAWESILHHITTVAKPRSLSKRCLVLPLDATVCGRAEIFLHHVLSLMDSTVGWGLPPSNRNLLSTGNRRLPPWVSGNQLAQGDALGTICWMSQAHLALGALRWHRHGTHLGHAQTPQVCVAAAYWKCAAAPAGVLDLGASDAAGQLHTIRGCTFHVQRWPNR